MVSPFIKTKKRVILITDGSCLHNPGGKGGWACRIKMDGKMIDLYGCEPCTTNNRMEILAVISGLDYLPPGCDVIVQSDSQYMRKGISVWIHGWKRNGWRTREGKDVANKDLWQRLEAVSKEHLVTWMWVRGHNGHADNERCDYLARRAAIQQLDGCEDHEQPVS